MDGVMVRIREGGQWGAPGRRSKQRLAAGDLVWICDVDYPGKLRPRGSLAAVTGEPVYEEWAFWTDRDIDLALILKLGEISDVYVRSTDEGADVVYRLRRVPGIEVHLVEHFGELVNEQAAKDRQVWDGITARPDDRPSAAERRRRGQNTPGSIYYPHRPPDDDDFWQWCNCCSAWHNHGPCDCY